MTLSQYELNVKAIEALGLRVKNNPLEVSLEKETKSFFQLKDIDLKTGQVAFYFSAYNVKDSDGDIILPGAFKKTFKENKSRIKHLYNHDRTQSPGVITELGDDEKGAFAVSQLYKAPHTVGTNVHIEYESGGITEHSMGFRVIRETMDRAAEANIIKEISLWEVSSLTAWGANQFTPVIGVKDVKELEGNNEWWAALKSLKF